MVHIDNGEPHFAFVFLIEFDGAPGLAFGIETAFPVDDDVCGLVAGSALFEMIAGDERAVMAVAGVVEMFVEF